MWSEEYYAWRNIMLIISNFTRLYRSIRREYLLQLRRERKSPAYPTTLASAFIISLIGCLASLILLIIAFETR